MNYESFHFYNSDWIDISITYKKIYEKISESQGLKKIVCRLAKDS